MQMINRGKFISNSTSTENELLFHTDREKTHLKPRGMFLVPYDGSKFMLLGIVLRDLLPNIPKRDLEKEKSSSHFLHWH